MKKKINPAGCILLALIFNGCSQKQFSVSSEPANGSPGDIVLVKTKNLTDAKNAKVTIGKETAFIISSSDSVLAVMIPPLAAQVTKLNVTAGKQTASADFEINAPATTRLWFSMKNNLVTFLESQASNEDFVQDKSYSSNKLMYEVYDQQGKTLAVGYLNNPVELEAPMQDKKGLSKIEIKEEVKFSINLPAFTDMTKIKLSVINASSNYKPANIGEVAIPIKK